jgi:hypothetical protein
MKLTTNLTVAHIIAFNELICRIVREETANHNSQLAINSNTLRKDFTEVGYLEPFDTAFIAYQMMGLK